MIPPELPPQDDDLDDAEDWAATMPGEFDEAGGTDFPWAGEDDDPYSG